MQINFKYKNIKLSPNKINQLIEFVVLLVVALLSINQIYYNKLDLIDSFVSYTSLLFSAATIPILFFKIVYNLPKIEVQNGMIEYKNIFHNYKFIVKKSQVYFEKKYLMDFLVIRDKTKSVYILTSELTEEFYQKLLGAKNIML